MTQQELHDAFVSFIESGDEEGARAFLIEHLNDFPEQIKKEIAFAFFADAVAKEAALDATKKTAIEMMKELDTVESILSDAEKAANIRNDL